MAWSVQVGEAEAETMAPGDRVEATAEITATALWESTQAAAFYDKLDGAFTRFQVILFNGPGPDAPLPFYFNYDRQLYSRDLVDRFCGHFRDALLWMISGGKR